MTKPNAHGQARPHERCCDECRVERACWRCGEAITRMTRCTQGACLKCHGIGKCGGHPGPGQ